METDAGFEAALDQLERVVAELEGGALGLDGALAKYEEGVRLLCSCHRLLDGVERRVALVTGVDASGSPETIPFDAPAGSPPREKPRAVETDGGAEEDLPF